jgi:hypothetical protein
LLTYEELYGEVGGRFYPLKMIIHHRHHENALASFYNRGNIIKKLN